MTWAKKSPVINLGVAESTGLGALVTLTTGADAGDVVVVWASTKATGFAAGGASTQVTVQDSKGNSYLRASEYASPPTGFGPRASVHYSVVTAPLVSGDTVTIGFSGAGASGLSQFRDAAVGVFTKVAGNIVSVAAATGNFGGATANQVSGSIAGLAVGTEYLYLAAIANRNTGTLAIVSGDTTNGWALGAGTSTGTSGGTTMSGLSVHWNYRIASVTGVTNNTSGLIVSGFATLALAALREKQLALQPAGLAVAPPVLDSPVFTGQVTVSTGALEVSAPTLGTPVLAAWADLSTAELPAGQPELGAPDLQSFADLGTAVEAVAGDPVLDAPILTVNSGALEFTAPNLVAQPFQIDAKPEMSVANMLATSLTWTTQGPSLDALPAFSSLSGGITLEASALTIDGPSIDAPTFLQNQVLDAAGLEVSEPYLGSPEILIGVISLEAVGVTVDAPVFGAPEIRQSHVLATSGTGAAFLEIIHDADAEDGISLGPVNGSFQKFAQTFTTTDAVTLAKASTWLCGYGTLTDTIILDLCLTSGGVPSTVVASSNELTIALDTFAEYTFDFANVALDATTQYAIVARRTGALDNLNRYGFKANWNAPYSGGSLYGWNGSWTSFTEYDSPLRLTAPGSGLSAGAPAFGAPELLIGVISLVADGITVESPAIGAPTFLQNQVLTADLLEVSAPSLGSPAFSIGQVELEVAAFTVPALSIDAKPEMTVQEEGAVSFTAPSLDAGAPLIDAPAIAQEFNFTAAGTVITPAIGAPSLSLANFQFTAEGLVVGAPAIGAPSLSLGGVVQFTTANLVVDAPTLDSLPAFSSVSTHKTFTAADLTVGAPVLPTPSLQIGEIVQFTADNVDIGAPTLGTPAITDQTVHVSVTSSEVAPVVGAPALTIEQAKEFTAEPLIVGAPSIGAPVIGIEGVLACASLTAGDPSLGAPALVQHHVLATAGLTDAAPSLGTPAIATFATVQAANLNDGVPVLGSPTFVQKHVLSTAAALAAGAPSIGSPALATYATVQAANVNDGAPVLGAPAIKQVHVLGTAGVTAGVDIGAPVIGIEGVMACAPLAAGAPVIGAPTFTQNQVLGASALNDGAPAIAAPAFNANVQVATPAGLTDGAPALGTPAIGQNHHLTAAPLVAGVDIGVPTIGIAGVMACAPLTAGAPALGSPAIAQKHVLAGSSVEAGAPQPGTPALTPNAVCATAGLSVSGPEIGAPAFNGNVRLVPTNLNDGAPAFTSPVLVRKVALATTERAAGTPVIGAPTFKQKQVLGPADGIAVGAPEVGSPALTPRSGMVATNLVVTGPAIGAPQFRQVHALAGASMRSGYPVIPQFRIYVGSETYAVDLVAGDPDIGAPVFHQKQKLVAAGVVAGAVQFDALQLVQDHKLGGRSIAVSGPIFTKPSMHIRVNFVTDELLAGEPVIGLPDVMQVLGADGLAIGPPELLPIDFWQYHVLRPRDLTVGGPVLPRPPLHQEHVLGSISIDITGPIYLGTPSMHWAIYIEPGSADVISSEGAMIGEGEDIQIVDGVATGDVVAVDGASP